MEHGIKKISSNGPDSAWAKVLIATSLSVTSFVHNTHPFLSSALTLFAAYTASMNVITVDPSCVEAFKKLKDYRTLKYIIYKLSDDQTSILVEKTSPTRDYDAFLAELPPADCRYAVCEFDCVVKSRCI